MDRRIKIFDTTLRDGEQAPGCSMNLIEKIEIAKQLESLGVDVIEAGFAISSPGDFESVKEISKTVKKCAVSSLARANIKDIDAAYEATKEAVHPVIHIFIATSDIHMKYKLKKTPEEVLTQAIEMVKYGKSLCDDIEFSAEDAGRSDLAFLAKVVTEVIKAGANTINLPDTVGYRTPIEIAEMIGYIKKNVPNIDQAIISVHCHNDLGLGVANSIAGIEAGAGQVECTINGLGERAGNAALEEIVMVLKTRYKRLQCITNVDTTQIYRTSKLVYNILGMIPPINKPIVGANAFAHEAGIHQHGVLAEKSTYEIMTPESVGVTKNNMVLGKHSGKHAFSDRLKSMGYNLAEQEIEVAFKKFKDLCDKKKEIYDSDLEAIVANKEQEIKKIELLGFEVHTRSDASSICSVKLRYQNKEIEKVSLGYGPIDASFNAINKVVSPLVFKLESYIINAVTDGVDAQGEVVAKVKVQDKMITGRGLSSNIIESSIRAYINAINKYFNMGVNK
ncbi:MAG: 2-isopropylmalate synthase [Bacilli bacterium]|nr:2-isopropylmalate synthase [Bacilli bacterium]